MTTKQISAAALTRNPVKDQIVLLVVLMLVVIPVLSPFTNGISGRGLRNALLQGVGILLLAVLLGRVKVRGGLSRLGYLTRSGVNAPVAALLLWTALGAWWAPERPFAVGELLRLATGVLIYFTVALHLEARAQLELLLDYVMALAILMVGYGLIAQGSDAGAGISSIFPSRHHLSAVLTVLFPLLGSLALGLEEPQRRLAAGVTALLCLAGLLLCLERAAWIATVVGSLVWLGLAGSIRQARLRRAWRLVAATTGFSLIVALGFFASTDVDAFVSHRAGQITDAVHGRDESFSWRVQRWHGALRMVSERPLWGWGPGHFPLVQSTYTQLGSPREVVRQWGASFDELAFNEYLQTAAELGLPGLALYLAILVGFFCKGVHALGRLPTGLRRTVLLGCMAGVAAQMVDALANGSWRFTECSLFFWLILGLGVAVIRMAYQGPPTLSASEALPITPLEARS
jgi:putative inorganic carbon (HCO3(-)) transporter